MADAAAAAVAEAERQPKREISNPKWELEISKRLEEEFKARKELEKKVGGGNQGEGCSRGALPTTHGEAEGTEHAMGLGGEEDEEAHPPRACGCEGANRTGA